MGRLSALGGDAGIVFWEGNWIFRETSAYDVDMEIDKLFEYESYYVGYLL